LGEENIWDKFVNMEEKETLSVLVMKEGNQWVAQCLEYDVASQGVTIQEAIYEFDRTFMAFVILYSDVRRNSPLETFLKLLKPSPKYYCEKYKNAQKSEKNKYEHDKYNIVISI
jgi:hypothetical protein